MANHDLNLLEFLQGFRRGELLNQGDAALSELVTAMNETGQGGSLTIKLGFKVNKAGQVECQPDIAVKKPRGALGVGVYFATEDGRLSRRDPKQLDIEDEIARRRDLA